MVEKYRKEAERAAIILDRLLPYFDATELNYGEITLRFKESKIIKADYDLDLEQYFVLDPSLGIEAYSSNSTELFTDVKKQIRRQWDRLSKATFPLSHADLKQKEALLRQVEQIS